jgi:hypothetical protein
MLGSSVLEVAIGIVFIYLLLSLICTALNEGISSVVNKRGKNLFDGIKNMLNDPEFTGLAQQVYHHGLVDGISQNASNPDKATRLPSYLHSNNFSLALLDILGSRGALASTHAPATADKLRSAQEAVVASVKDPANLSLVTKAAEALEQALAAGRSLAASCPDPLANIQAGVNGLTDDHSKESLLVLIDKTRREVTSVEHQAEAFRKNLESWYNEAMDRIGGWYKRWTQKVLLALAFAVVVATNADTLMLAERLTMDGAVRASLVNAAQDAAKLPAPEGGANGTAGSSGDARINVVLTKAKDLALPLGWTFDSNDPRHVPALENNTLNFSEWLLFKILGLMVSAFAVSLGAPFWFDMLSRVSNIRGAGAAPATPKKTEPQHA